MDPDALRADIPALDDATYLNTGASGPSPRRVVAAAEDALERQAFDAPAEDGAYATAFDVYDEARAAVADHVGADPTDVALTESTGDGIARVAAAMDWEPGDVVVTTDLEHAAGTLPWRRLERLHDVEVRVVETDGGRVDRDRFAEAVRGARLASFSSVSWTAGTRLPVAELTSIAQDAGARVLVDAVQSVGQHPVDVSEWGADAVAASGHKWLLGDWGGGFCYLSRDFAERLHPANLGYFGVEYPPTADYDLKAGAARFEVGTTSLAPCAALREAIAVIEDVGYEAIEARIERLTDRLKDGLDDERLHSPRRYESGLVSVRVDDPAATVESLRERGVRVKRIRDTDLIRASVHAFNTAADVDRLLAGL
ncbi:aminotransferase class V-fold PLP-dependent enzyme [Halomicrobium salinisoli]|uniref:aminotransferase class V-fold PLP-dependent enzyme n=1 Tax=Halomicrobium salinisoli TaxID=2878391 RepID=UPI001CF0AEB4|nr:aminotransferase class V-fold PLP-dependent enzyme [Halomicrobium salinisoli]